MKQENSICNFKKDEVVSTLKEGKPPVYESWLKRFANKVLTILYQCINHNEEEGNLRTGYAFMGTSVASGNPETPLQGLPIYKQNRLKIGQPSFLTNMFSYYSISHTKAAEFPTKSFLISDFFEYLEVPINNYHRVSISEVISADIAVAAIIEKPYPGGVLSVMSGSDSVSLVPDDYDLTAGERKIIKDFIVGKFTQDSQFNDFTMRSNVDAILNAVNNSFEFDEDIFEVYLLPISKFQDILTYDFFARHVFDKEKVEGFYHKFGLFMLVAAAYALRTNGVPLTETNFVSYCYSNVFIIYSVPFILKKSFFTRYVSIPVHIDVLVEWFKTKSFDVVVPMFKEQKNFFEEYQKGIKEYYDGLDKVPKYVPKNHPPKETPREEPPNIDDDIEEVVTTKIVSFVNSAIPPKNKTLKSDLREENKASTPLENPSRMTVSPPEEFKIGIKNLASMTPPSTDTKIKNNVTLNNYISSIRNKLGDDLSMNVIKIQENISNKSFINWFAELPPDKQIIPQSLMKDIHKVLSSTHSLVSYTKLYSDNQTYEGYTSLDEGTISLLIPDIWIQYRNEHPVNKRGNNSYLLTTTNEVFRVRINNKIDENKILSLNSFAGLLDMLNKEGDIILYADTTTTIKPVQVDSLRARNLLSDNFTTAMKILAEDYYEAVKIFDKVPETDISILSTSLIKGTDTVLESDGTPISFPSYNVGSVKLQNKSLLNIFPKAKVGILNQGLVEHLRGWQFEEPILEVLKTHISGQIMPAFTWLRNSIVQKRALAVLNEYKASKIKNDILNVFGEVTTGYKMSILHDNDNYIPANKKERYSSKVSNLGNYGVFHLLSRPQFFDEFSKFLFKTEIQIENTDPIETYFKTYVIGDEEGAISTYNSSSRGFPLMSEKRSQTIGTEIATYPAFKQGILDNDMFLVPLLSTYYSKIKREALEFFKKDGSFKMPRSFQVNHSIISLELSTLSGLFKRCLDDYDNSGNLLNFSIMSPQFQSICRYITGDIPGIHILNFSDNIFVCQDIGGERTFSSLDVKNAESSVNPTLYELYFRLIIKCLPNISSSTKEYLRIFLKNQLVNSAIAPDDEDKIFNAFIDFMPSGLFCTTDLNHINTSLLVFLCRLMSIKPMKAVGELSDEFTDLCLFLGLKLTVSLSSKVEFEPDNTIFDKLKLYKADFLGYDIILLPNGEYAPILNYTRLVKQILFYKGMEESAEKSFIVQKAIIVSGWAYKIIIPTYLYLLGQLRNPDTVKLMQIIGDEVLDDYQMTKDLAVIVGDLKGNVLPPSVRSILRVIGVSASPYSFYEQDSDLHKLIVEGDEIVGEGSTESILKELLTSEAYNLIIDNISRRRGFNKRILRNDKKINYNTLLLKAYKQDAVSKGMPEEDLVLPKILYYDPAIATYLDDSSDSFDPNWQSHYNYILKIAQLRFKVQVDTFFDMSKHNKALRFGEKARFIPDYYFNKDNIKLIKGSMVRVISQITSKLSLPGLIMRKGKYVYNGSKVEDKFEIFITMSYTLGPKFLDAVYPDEVGSRSKITFDAIDGVTILPMQRMEKVGKIVDWAKLNMEKYGIVFKHGSKVITYKSITANSMQVPIFFTGQVSDTKGFYYDGGIDDFQHYLTSSPFILDRLAGEVLSIRNMAAAPLDSTHFKIAGSKILAPVDGNGVYRYPCIREGFQFSAYVNNYLHVVQNTRYNLESRAKALAVETAKMEDLDRDNYLSYIMTANPNELRYNTVQSIEDTTIRNGLLFRGKGALTLRSTWQQVKDYFTVGTKDYKSNKKGYASLEAPPVNEETEYVHEAGEGTLYRSSEMFMVMQKGGKSFYFHNSELKWLFYQDIPTVYSIAPEGPYILYGTSLFTIKAAMSILDKDEIEFDIGETVSIPPGFKQYMINSTTLTYNISYVNLIGSLLLPIDDFQDM